MVLYFGNVTGDTVKILLATCKKGHDKEMGQGRTSNTRGMDENCE